MIALMDCNNFFVSCERLFRPDIAKQPVAVLSSNDGCIVSRSKEVKDLGIPMGAPYFEVKDMCDAHHVVLFSSHFTLYRDISNRVMSALRDECDNVEVYSVDEAFFEVSSTITVDELRGIRDRIITKTGIPVSIGVGKTKTLAKVGSDLAKKGNGVAVIDDEFWEDYRKQVTCGSIWGIGRRIGAVLLNNGVTTVEEFLALDPTYVKSRWGVAGERIHLELRGVSAFTLYHDETPPQSIASTRSFERATHARRVVESALSYHASHLAEKLRSGSLLASSMTVLALPDRFGDFAGRAIRVKRVLPSPTSNTTLFIKNALELFSSLYDLEVPYKKAGIILSNIIPKNQSTFPMFEKKPDEHIDTVLDAINKRFGHGTLRHALVNQNGWKAKAELCSPQYTTSWNSLKIVRAKDNPPVSLNTSDF